MGLLSHRIRETKIRVFLPPVLMVGQQLHGHLSAAFQVPEQPGEGPGILRGGVEAADEGDADGRGEAPPEGEGQMFQSGAVGRAGHPLMDLRVVVLAVHDQVVHKGKELGQPRVDAVGLHGGVDPR